MRFSTFVAAACLTLTILAGCASNPYRPGGTMCDNLGACAAPNGSATTGLPTATAPAATVTTINPPPAEPFEIAKKGGCIGKTLDACLQNLRVGFRFNEANPIGDQISRNDAVDVNGKRIAKKNILSLFGILEGWIRISELQSVEGLERISELQSITIEYTQDKIINYIAMSLPNSLFSANTEADYAKSGLYEGMVLLLGSECPTINRLEVYRFFQNSVKPNIVSEGEKTEFSDTGVATRYFQKALDIPFCGRKFSYTYLFGHNTQYITLENEHGGFSRTSISFK